MYKPEKLTSNWSLTTETINDEGTDTVCGFCDAIGAQRPLRDENEVACAMAELNNVLACMEHGLELSDSHAVNEEATTHGLRIIIGACRLVSLRVEQYHAINNRR